MPITKIPVLTLVTRLLVAGGLAGLTAISGAFAYRFAQAEVSAEIYRERLEALEDEYASLRVRYNDAVARTAVTELLVFPPDERGGVPTLSVRVRSQAGVIRTIDTPYDPRGEVYVDYIVREGRLWIRRVFDENTPPGLGLVIEPELAQIDWRNATVGKAVYRSLEPGLWVVSVTGTGSLGLERISESPDAGGLPLASAPEVRDYEGVTDEADQKAQGIGWREVMDRFLNGSPPSGTGTDAPDPD